MAEDLPDTLRSRLQQACHLHDRAGAESARCLDFQRLLAELLEELEDRGFRRTAAKVLSILRDCCPREGARCDHAVRIQEQMRRL